MFRTIARRASSAAKIRVPILREPTPSPAAAPCTTCTILSANVAGLRSVLKSDPGAKRRAFFDCVRAVAPDVLLLQEHKLQRDDACAFLDDVRGTLREGEGSSSSWEHLSFACSEPPARKGYAGVATFTSRRVLQSWAGFPANDVRLAVAELEPQHAAVADIVACEGRLITTEFEEFYLVNAYVPNAGASKVLARLDFRVAAWDRILRAYLCALEQGTVAASSDGHGGGDGGDGGSGVECLRPAKPVLLVGDLNVAHRVTDMHNFYNRPKFPDIAFDDYTGVTSLKRQAGCTPEERASFSRLLDKGFVDCFAHLHPDARGCFTYWGYRHDNRSVNYGLRIDYCVASQSLVDAGRVLDCFICDGDAPFSDHCAVGITLSI